MLAPAGSWNVNLEERANCNFEGMYVPGLSWRRLRRSSSQGSSRVKQAKALARGREGIGRQGVLMMAFQGDTM